MGVVPGASAYFQALHATIAAQQHKLKLMPAAALQPAACWGRALHIGVQFSQLEHLSARQGCLNVTRLRFHSAYFDLRMCHSIQVNP